jgi:hypothetical protein
LVLMLETLPRMLARLSESAKARIPASSVTNTVENASDFAAMPMTPTMAKMAKAMLLVCIVNVSRRAVQQFARRSQCDLDTFYGQFAASSSAIRSPIPWR